MSALGGTGERFGTPPFAGILLLPGETVAARSAGIRAVQPPPSATRASPSSGPRREENELLETAVGWFLSEELKLRHGRRRELPEHPKGDREESKTPSRLGRHRTKPPAWIAERLNV